jgi:hypothetical protein
MLPPQAVLDLQIHLDRLKRNQERCRQGLSQLAEGKLTADAYCGLLERQRLAQEAWEQRTRRYFGGLENARLP